MEQKIDELRYLINEYEGMLDKNDMGDLWQEIL